MRIIIGLGNPGQPYENTRHNAGFMVIDALADRLGLTWEHSKKFKANLAKNSGLILVKPMDFMNNSGFSAAAVLSYYKLLPEGPAIPETAGADLSGVLTVVHDDLDIELGKFKISMDSGSAGHKGVESIISRLNTKNFRRIRVGIKTPLHGNLAGETGRNKTETAEFVLQKFDPAEKKTIQGLINIIIEKINQ